MPLYIDIHRNVDASPEEVAEAHRKDVEIQDKYGAKFMEYWVDEDDGTVFCLFEAPDGESGKMVHSEAHGLVADEIHRVRRGT